MTQVDSGASFVGAVLMCLLVAHECCCSGTCSRGSEDCRPLMKSFSNVLSLFAQTAVICHDDLHRSDRHTPLGSTPTALRINL